MDHNTLVVSLLVAVLIIQGIYGFMLVKLMCDMNGKISEAIKRSDPPPYTR